jgi:hypothetical protein
VPTARPAAATIGAKGGGPVVPIDAIFVSCIKKEGMGLMSAMDRFELEGAGARGEMPLVRGLRLVRALREPLPLWQAGAQPRVRRPADEAQLAKFRGGRVGAAIPSPVADPVRGDQASARAVAKVMPSDSGGRERGVEIVGCLKRRRQSKDAVASLAIANSACFDASKGTRVWA